MIDDHPMEEPRLVAAAVAGSDDAFRQLVEPLRRELHLLCYRMTGSYHDAEDAVQDAQLKAWRSLDRYDGRATFRTWMYRVATNACLDALRSRRRRVLPQDVSSERDPALGLGDERHDIPWLEPYPDAQLPQANPAEAVELRESVRLAFVWALQELPPRQRAALILRDVLDWSASEVATALATSVASVNSALQRARATVAERNATTNREVPDALRDAQRSEMTARYINAWEAGDMDAIVSMLTTGATHAMPPWAAWFAGRERLRTLYSGYEPWRGRPGPGVFRILPAAVNGELAFAEYCRLEAGAPYTALAFTIATLDASGTRIAAKTSFVSHDLVVKLGFPDTLAEAPQDDHIVRRSLP